MELLSSVSLVLTIPVWKAVPSLKVLSSNAIALLERTFSEGTARLNGDMDKISRAESAGLVLLLDIDSGIKTVVVGVLLV